MRPVRLRGWIEVVLAVVSGLLCLLTLFWPDWIDEVFRVDPDQHSGALEWAIAVRRPVHHGRLLPAGPRRVPQGT
ncbi:hypothetical protein M2163_001009 [Streptomyces sp. SAI-135]|jgi:hypothetical protein|uniref:hypothetical protein n=1 Tax=unclassified Streptomyces TaxID=2593676 RepID=UPI002473E00A|nr:MULTISPECIES: hypothetical protein [unclassified Streptomyces]MDH6521996.1 hypothetical protein [Streptomyces sp. SAI-090]MDH6573365.1 hypothetical protein [Streptomyces sp. SAI-117]MDH6613901.1 hypothetical protein [Streptomyces sp. SAI-135]